MTRTYVLRAVGMSWIRRVGIQCGRRKRSGCVIDETRRIGVPDRSGFCPGAYFELLQSQSGHLRSVGEGQRKESGRFRHFLNRLGDAGARFFRSRETVFAQYLMQLRIGLASWDW